MPRRHRIRATGFAVALTAVLLGAQPAAAETVLQACAGECGNYEIDDSPAPKRGANCIYGKDATTELDRITIRPPTNVHGSHAQNTWVGWRFIIDQGIGESIPDWNTYYTSPIQKDRANDAIPEDGFVRRTWVAPKKHPDTALYKVRIRIYWYEPGSQTIVEGKAHIEYDWYKAKFGGASYINEDYCVWFY
jgi:hypothetical protein